MLIYVIDAFNLIHAVPELADSTAPHADCIAFLKAGRFTGSRTNRVVIAFDGYPEESVAGERDYELLFGKNRSADDLIREFVTKAAHPRQVVVVSDDRAVQGSARAEGAEALTNAEFLKGRRRAAVREKPRDGDEALDAASRNCITKELEKLWLKK